LLLIESALILLIHNKEVKEKTQIVRNPSKPDSNPKEKRKK